MASEPIPSLCDPATLRMLVSRLRTGVYITSRSGRLLDANPACLRLLGASSLKDLQRYSVEDLFVDPTQRSEELELIAQQGHVNEFELQLRDPRDGHIRTVLDTCYQVTDPTSGECIYHGILVDITDRKRLEEQLKEAAIRDPLTGCFNRRYLEEAEPEVTELGEWGAIVLDIDQFKRFNDEHGHKAGDDVLIRTARFLFRQVRAEDAVVRMGGDEFLVLLAGPSSAATELVAGRLKNASHAQAPAPFTLGWAVRDGDETLERTIIRADRSLIRVRWDERHERRRGRG